MTKQGFNPWFNKNAITIITILLLYFVGNVIFTFNFNYVFAIITIMTIGLDCHRWKVTTCININNCAWGNIHIKSKLKNMTPRGDDEWKTFLGGEGKENLFFLGINRRWFEHTTKRLRMRKHPFKPTRQVNIPKPTSQSWLFLNCRILQNGRGGCCNKGHKNLKVIKAHEINLVHYSMKSLQSSHISLWL